MNNLPQHPWRIVEEIIKKIGEKTLGESYFSKYPDVLNFLSKTDFIFKDKIELTEKGKEYYVKYFVQADIDESKKILSELIRKHPATQAICQILWGRQNIKPENVYNLLKLEQLIDSNYKEDDLAAFLMILNYCGVINYSKRNQTIKINFNPKSQEKIPEDIFITSETPYGNIINLKKVIRDCKKYIHWFDKNFGSKGLEVLFDEVDGNNVNSIKILTSLDQNITKKMKSEFGRFREEMKTRGIESEMRVILDKSLTRDIHDRWLIGNNTRYNLPPINSIFQNQASEIKKTINNPPFEKWWKQGIPLIEEFNKIMIEKGDE